MEDKQILDLYFERNESAISETDKKYGRYCHYIAYQILHSDADAGEIVNDAYFEAWNAIPPKEPNPFKGYLGMLTSRRAYDRYDKMTAHKRGGGQMPLVIDELEECVSGRDDDFVDKILLQNALSQFLWSLPERTRHIFIRRYFYVSSTQEIAKDFGMKESNISVLLLRTRNKLKAYLQKEGFIL